MIFKTIDFHLYTNYSNVDYSYAVKLKTKHICNYIERNCLKPLKFQTKDNQGIIISFRHGYNDATDSTFEPKISPTNRVSCTLAFDKEKYDRLKTDNDYREFCLESLLQAFETAKGKYEIPTTEILESFEELRQNNFVNEWLHKKKAVKTKKILVELHCAMTIDQFQLTLKVSQNNKEIYKKVILETDPDEFAFQYKLGDILVDDEAIIITTKTKKELYKLSFSELV